ncbi:probable disease resistance protein RPP1 isoform X1 [Rosa rugosa]|uniref:probable disease resistance protein RPP1 isoform X1 n=1 Tax=Rosa rugosa TaxID=74645 RepID=UPI002B405B86|nr:probable disease resistance protein RPP1 isoform X1 [Rosa rugosa]XP_062026359.1 probable disease resistance protein RPP1 isoform X1 [Rosa rugosa]XP_062026360.1 probable disease resistance protein RPP1 isoform X1 [Rosa rugosa]XP_062026362.1 probable disease resistance protein RPP1 isoform X1 [Rosa rugosa]
MALLRASAEPASPRRWKHDVFLSFRGEDTRKGIVSHLYNELQNRRGIKTFKDDQQLEIGTAISPSLLTAIQESWFAIIVLSPNYASSSWCLDELAHIFQCMEDKNRILPLFYHVDPSDVRHQRGSFQVAFTKHEQLSRQDMDKVKQWRDALNKVAYLCGWDAKNYESERELVKSIVTFVCSKVLQVSRPIEMESIMHTGDFEAFEATRQAMDKVMSALKDDNITVIGINGMGGVGKTTMVTYVSSQAKRDGIFDHVIMACISENPDLIKIQGILADMLGMQLKEETEIGRAGRLKDRIMRGNRVLIILDDLWKNINLSSIGIPSYNELRKCKSKLLLTTRRLSVCHVMRSQAIIPLNILSKEDSWSLFVKEVGHSFHESTRFYDIARKVARECAGLPIALITVARALRYKDMEEWEEAARRLGMSQPASLDDEGDVFKCIKLSYDYLKSDLAKSCFLLCCLFPEDYDIRIEDLLKYGISHGLFRDSNTMNEARARIHSVVKYLKASNLLSDSEIDGCVRMHDVIRDMAISTTLSENNNGFLVKAGLHNLSEELKRSRVEERWERLVGAVLCWKGKESTFENGSHGIGIDASSQANWEVQEILKVADEIQLNDPIVSRILCEHSYQLALYLNSNSDRNGVLQLKSGLMNVWKQKQARLGGETVDRSQDFLVLQKFYKLYREKNNVEKLREEEMKLRESGSICANLGELERKTSIRKRVSATLRILETVLEQLEETPDEKTSQVEERGTCDIGKTSQVEERWEHIVHAVLKRERLGTDAYRRHGTGIVGKVRSSFAISRVINKILDAADEIEDENLIASRILCDQGYLLPRDLDSDSEGNGVLQFKASLMSVTKQGLSLRRSATATIDRSEDFVLLQQFYKLYREKNNVEKLLQEKMKMRECSTSSSDNLRESQIIARTRRVFATLTVLRIVLEMQLKQDDTQEIPQELKRLMESDAARIEDLDDYDMNL